jgi:hypothetical protein
MPPFLHKCQKVTLFELKKKFQLFLKYATAPNSWEHLQVRSNVWSFIKVLMFIKFFTSKKWKSLIRTQIIPGSSTKQRAHNTYTLHVKPAANIRQWTGSIEQNKDQSIEADRDHSWKNPTWPTFILLLYPQANGMRYPAGSLSWVLTFPQANAASL